jgi:hypothetical protein
MKSKADRKKLSILDTVRDRLSKMPVIYDLWLTLRCINVKGYIFVASTGRSGTQSLSRIFAAAQKAVCVHEPPPVMLRRCPQGMDEAQYFRELFHQKKKHTIRRRARSHRYYLETNHQFAKTFADLAIEYFKTKTSVIHLRRDPLKVAASFYNIGSIPGKSYRGKLYLLDPLGTDNCIDLRDMFREGGPLDHDYYRCLWYWYEVEARIEKLKHKYPQTRWFQLDTQDLNDEVRLQKMFTALAIEYDAKMLKGLVSTRVNLKQDEKQSRSDVLDLTLMHRTFLETLDQG